MNCVYTECCRSLGFMPDDILGNFVIKSSSTSIKLGVYPIFRHTSFSVYIYTQLFLYIFLHRYLHTYIHTYIPTYLYTNLPTNLPTYVRKAWSTSRNARYGSRPRAHTRSIPPDPYPPIHTLIHTLWYCVIHTPFSSFAAFCPNTASGPRTATTVAATVATNAAAAPVQPPPALPRLLLLLPVLHCYIATRYPFTLIRCYTVTSYIAISCAHYVLSCLRGSFQRVM